PTPPSSWPSLRSRRGVRLGLLTGLRLTDSHELHTVYKTPKAIIMAITRVPLRDQIYHEVLARIHRGDLSPGSRVRDTTLAQQLGVSRTPVREALLRLSREGVLDIETGRGFRLRPL